MTGLIDKDATAREQSCTDKGTEKIERRLLTDFLIECANGKTEWPRIRCPHCHVSRVMYCPSCVKVLIDEQNWPLPLQYRRHGHQDGLRLPFAVDFILDDRHTSATGIAVMALLQRGDNVSDTTTDFNDQIRDDVRLFDVECGNIPDYARESSGTFLLFPDETSVPLSSLDAKAITRLVLLDCKWSKSKIRHHAHIAQLQKVHLDDPPTESFYWRWHNSGKGMLSTIEALYYAAYQVAETRQWSVDQRKRLVYMFWLFGIQREVIRKRYEVEAGKTLPKHMPFTESGKQYNRDLRRQQGLMMQQMKKTTN